MNWLRHRMKVLDPILKPPELSGKLQNYNYAWQSLRLSIVAAMQLGYDI